MDVFNAVFVTRNSFLHSPALCYHFEEVLIDMIKAKFSPLTKDGSYAIDHHFLASQNILSTMDEGSASLLHFLVNKLLHSPFWGGLYDVGNTSSSRSSLVDVVSSSGNEGSTLGRVDGGMDIGANLSVATTNSGSMSTSIKMSSNHSFEGNSEAHIVHDETRILCLRLIQYCLRDGFSNQYHFPLGSMDDEVETNKTMEKHRNVIVQIIQDHLCFSLLTIGQMTWTYLDPTNDLLPGVLVSTEVLSEVCTTLSTLWNLHFLQSFLISQFEAIFTGFYQRSLSLLRRLPVPNNADVFHANQTFDTEVEIILESLVDMLCLYSRDTLLKQGRMDDFHGGGGALEEIFLLYDCNKIRADVASNLIVELCRCCGGILGEDGMKLIVDDVAGSSREISRGESQIKEIDESVRGGFRQQNLSSDIHIRHVPAHLRELCAQALLGSMKRLFLDESKSMEKDSNVDSGIVNNNNNDINKSEGQGTDSLNPSKIRVENNHQTIASSLRHLKHQKRMAKEAARLFNIKPSSGIRFLSESKIFSTELVTPCNVAAFLRNGVVLGLDKKAIGEYLGEAGKTPAAGGISQPPNWERDRFHAETLTEYCSTFSFEDQTLLDGLRMFLAAFRLPGEAQQIDRILQAFSECCGKMCAEAHQRRLSLFSPDEKKASDAAYLLSFSIIMLNTDLHNVNIRKDRKMKLQDFIRNNSDYGRDITDPGKELPSEYLQSIYESIKDDQIRTESEGADGIMTFDRWKDMLNRGKNMSLNDNLKLDCIYYTHRKEAREIIVETLWLPILSAIGAGFWGIRDNIDENNHHNTHSIANTSGMLGTQGARLGMDLSVEMLSGISNLPISYLNIFQEFFVSICSCTGLLGNYESDAVTRTASFIESIERQSALVIALKTAKENGDAIGKVGWKCVWAMLFELRDLKLLSGPKGSNSQTMRESQSILFESDPDLLRQDSRREWSMDLLKESYEASGGSSNYSQGSQSHRSGLFGVMGRVFSRSNDNLNQGNPDNGQKNKQQSLSLDSTNHGKEELVLWDDLALSDDEYEESENIGEGNEPDYTLDLNSPLYNYSGTGVNSYITLGTAFEQQLIYEDRLSQSGAPVTGLETFEDTNSNKFSPRARTRRRINAACDFAGLITESRFLSLNGIQDIMNALAEIITFKERDTFEIVEQPDTNGRNENRTEGISSYLAKWNHCLTVTSPASEAFAEILLCEIALKNRDRIAFLLQNILLQHYEGRLSDIKSPFKDISQTNLLKQQDLEEQVKPINPISSAGLEKCITGLLRICYHTVHREEVVDKVLSYLSLIIHPKGVISMYQSSNLKVDKHLGEGLWRICRDVDGLSQVGVEGWEGLLGLIHWCASKGHAPLNDLADGGSSLIGRALPEDDVSIQAFKCIHLMLHSNELKDKIPFRIVWSIRALIVGGEMQNCPKLIVASLDLLSLLHTRLQSLISKPSTSRISDESIVDNDKEIPTSNKILQIHDRDESTKISLDGEFWITCWIPVLEGISEASESRYPNVRQHAIAMLTDAIIDKQAGNVPTKQLCRILNGTCIPVAGHRISELLLFDSNSYIMCSFDEIMIELELCLTLVFKPFLQHIHRLTDNPKDLAAIWFSILSVLSHLFGKEVKEIESKISATGNDNSLSYASLIFTTKNLAKERLRNAVMVLISNGVLYANTPEVLTDTDDLKDITSLTWNTIENISFCKGCTRDWRESTKLQDKETGDIS